MHRLNILEVSDSLKSVMGMLGRMRWVACWSIFMKTQEQEFLLEELIAELGDFGLEGLVHFGGSQKVVERNFMGDRKGLNNTTVVS